MGKAKLILGMAVLVALAASSWQIGSCEIANLELQSDLHDLSSLAGSRIGLEAPRSDDDLRNAVIHKAQEHGIELTPNQITVQRTGTEKDPVIFLSADYTARVNLLVFSFTLHFAPASAR